MDRYIQLISGSKDVFPQHPGFPGFFHSLFHSYCGIRVFTPDIYKSLMGFNGITGDTNPFHQQVGVSFHDLPVFEGPGFRLIRIAD